MYQIYNTSSLWEREAKNGSGPEDKDDFNLDGIFLKIIKKTQYVPLLILSGSCICICYSAYIL